MRTLEIHPEPYKSCFWEPKEDITVHELALCLGPLLAATGSTRRVEEFVESLPECARRHFRIENFKHF